MTTTDRRPAPRLLSALSAALLLAVALGAPHRSARAQEAPARWEPATTWALLVGILEWKDPGLVSFPKENRFDRALERTLLADGVPRDHVVFLEDRTATKQAIEAALAEIAGKAGAGSTLVFYFAGHGLREGQDVYLANYDVDLSKQSATGVGVAEIGRVLDEKWQGARLWLMADCCHSGALESVVRRVGKGARSAACLTSSTASNVSTGEWTFTESIVRALSGDGAVDEDHDGTVEWKEVDRFVQQEMRFKEKQLTEGRATGDFVKDLPLRAVDPAHVVPKVDGLWQIGDYCEVESEKQWYRSQILEAKDSGPGRGNPSPTPPAEGSSWKVHYLGWESKWDEWVDRARIRKPQGLTWTAGAKVEIEWEKKWYPAKLMRITGDFALVHYDGYGEEWDEWVGAARIRAPGAKTEPPQGKKKRK